MKVRNAYHNCFRYPLDLQDAAHGDGSSAGRAVMRGLGLQLTLGIPSPTQAGAVGGMGSGPAQMAHRKSVRPPCPHD